MPASSESLNLSASEPRPVGETMTVTVEGVADGSHRLFVYGGAIEHGCGIEHVEHLQQQTTLTPAEGETLAAGPFKREYDAVPALGGRYIVCAYLDAPPARFPDAWEVGCFWVPSGDCYESMISPAGILTAEELGRKVVADEERELSERQAREQGARERSAAEEAARAAREQAELNAREAARCHVPRLLGHTLATARRLLAEAHCRLGTVEPKHRPKGELRVRWQRPGKGGSHPAGTAVAVRVSR